MHRWKLSALAAAALVSVSLTATNAWALALGRLSIQSSLGEPLRAEVELPQITAAEADSLQARIAAPAVFRAQGMEYTAAAGQFRVQLQRRPDGSAVLRLSSTQPVTEPFVDLVIDASWSAGHVVRSYTLLLDPPVARQPAPAATAPQVGAPAPVQPAPQATAPVRSTPAPARAPAPAAPAPAPAPVQPAAQTVRAGDTAGRIAQAQRPSGVSLDQMLVAMLRANPHAFISGNVNRMRAGAVLEMPDRAAAQAISIPEARQIVAAQSQDFNRYRRQLAAAAPQAAVAGAQRSASGNVEAQVEDRKPATAAPDKLTLSKGAMAADDRLAREKQAQSQSERLAELSRNLNELQNVAGTTATAGTAATASAAGIPVPAVTAPGVTTPGVTTPGVATPGVATPATPSAEAPAAAPAAAETPAPASDGTPAQAPETAPPAPAATPAPATPPAPVAAPAPAEAPAAPGLLDTLGEDPVLPIAGAGLLALLLGLLGYRQLQRRRARNAAPDSLLQNDSFFAAGQGQQVDTAQTQFGSSAAYSHSQLDTGGEVDPVAEADVYLAYGRDLQAEEILKEALRTQPERLALHLKLAEIYAKRQDRKAFEALAQTVFALTQGKGAEWQQLAEQGRALDPANALYQSDGDALPGSAADRAAPPVDAGALAKASLAGALGGLAAASAAGTERDSEPDFNAKSDPVPTPAADPDFDLELDSILDDSPAPATDAVPAEPRLQPPGSIDFEPIEPIWKQPATAPSAADNTDDPLADLPSVPTDAAPAIEAAASDALPDLEFTLDSEADAREAEAPEPAFEDDAPRFEIAPLAPPEGEGSEAELPAIAAPQEAAPAAEPELDPEPETEPAPATQTPPAPAAAPAAAHAFDFLEFDLGNLSLDLGSNAPAEALSQSSQAAAEDPLATKLALAQEFAAIGDSEGARTLIEEVIDEAEGELKERARRLLSEID